MHRCIRDKLRVHSTFQRLHTRRGSIRSCRGRFKDRPQHTTILVQPFRTCLIRAINTDLSLLIKRDQHTLFRYLVLRPIAPLTPKTGTITKARNPVTTGHNPLGRSHHSTSAGMRIRLCTVGTEENNHQRTNQATRCYELARLEGIYTAYLNATCYYSLLGKEHGSW